MPTTMAAVPKTTSMLTMRSRYRLPGLPPCWAGLSPCWAGLPPYWAGLPPCCAGLPPCRRGLPHCWMGLPPWWRGLPHFWRGLPPCWVGLPPCWRGLPLPCLPPPPPSSGPTIWRASPPRRSHLLVGLPQFLLGLPRCSRFFFLLLRKPVSLVALPPSLVRLLRCSRAPVPMRQTSLLPHCCLLVYSRSLLLPHCCWVCLSRGRRRWAGLLHHCRMRPPQLLLLRESH